MRHNNLQMPPSHYTPAPPPTKVKTLSQSPCDTIKFWTCAPHCLVCTLPPPLQRWDTHILVSPGTLTAPKEQHWSFRTNPHHRTLQAQRIDGTLRMRDLCLVKIWHIPTILCLTLVSNPHARFHMQWTETTVRMKIADNIKSRDIVYKLTPTTLTMGIKGQDPLIDGELWVSWALSSTNNTATAREFEKSLLQHSSWSVHHICLRLLLLSTSVRAKMLQLIVRKSRRLAELKSLVFLHVTWELLFLNPIPHCTHTNFKSACRGVSFFWRQVSGKLLVRWSHVRSRSDFSFSFSFFLAQGTLASRPACQKEIRTSTMWSAIVNGCTVEI